MKHLLSFVLILMLATLIQAQAPESINYQAVARDASGNLLVNQSVRFRLSILSGSSSGTVVYSESQLKTTNAFGVASLAIGSGTVISGYFSTVNWGSSTHYLKTELDPNGGTSYLVMGTTQLISVPYALYAKNSGNNWSITGNSGTTAVFNFIGTTDNVGLKIKTYNQVSGIIDPVQWNTSLGYRALSSLTTGFSNVAIGVAALRNNYSRYGLVAIGDSALYSNGEGTLSGNQGLYNVAVGSKSLFSNTQGTMNTAVGYKSLYSNESGVRNSAFGYQALITNSTGSDNSAFGYLAMNGNTSGTNNVAIGNYSLKDNSTGTLNTGVGNSALSTNQTGSYNSALGGYAMAGNTTGIYNTAVGSSALQLNHLGNRNVAIGSYSLYNSNNVNGNTAMGYASLYDNTTGFSNVAIGCHALSNNTTASNLVAVGDSALFNNGTGASTSTHSTGNTALGSMALFNNTTGYYNVAEGFNSLYANTTGNNNTSVGYLSSRSLTTGLGNTTLGSVGLRNTTTGTGNTAVGYDALYYNITGSYNTAIGFEAHYSTNNISNTVCIGNGSGYLSGSNHAEIGNTSTTWIGGQVNWSIFSDARIKEDVMENVPGLAFISRLRPVTYKLNIHRMNEMANKSNDVDYPEKFDIEKIRMTGFIAQEVAQAAKEAGYDFSGVDAPKDGSLYSLRYSDFVMPLVKAVQEQQSTIEKQKVETARLLNLIENLEKRIEVLEKK